MGAYRPWGLLNWVLRRCPVTQWALYGCLSPEERCLEAWSCLSREGKLGRTQLLRILDKPSRHSELAKVRREERTRDFSKGGGALGDIRDEGLTDASHHEIVSSIDNFIHLASPNIMLDVSSMPKRFFFPTLRQLLRAPEVQNLVVTYTVPEDHTSEPLAEGFGDWAPLPLFTGERVQEQPEMLVVNVGFQPFGLLKQVEQAGSGLPIRLLFPFPAPAKAYRRSWEFVRRLQKHRRSSGYELHRTDAREVGDAFDRLVSLTDGGLKRALLAPFGPKPISVAMCVFATLTGSPVYYTQPTIYHPDYAIGVSRIDGCPETYAYCIRLNGSDYYDISA